MNATFYVTSQVKREKSRIERRECGVTRARRLAPRPSVRDLDARRIRAMAAAGNAARALLGMALVALVIAVAGE